MAFPETRLTLIQRLATGGSNADWQMFLSDYWGPVCRFALRWGAMHRDDAEDLASQTFEAVLRQKLLTRWMDHRTARLRTLLCSVVRHLLANRARVRRGHEQPAGDLWDESDRALAEQTDSFYAAWADDQLQRAVEAMAVEYFQSGRGDYVRVLYGRLCEGLTIAQVADSLGITPATVDNYFRHARGQLGERFSSLVRQQVARYCPADELDAEFAAEWGRLGAYLAAQGGLEDAVRQAYARFDPVRTGWRSKAVVAQAVTRLTALLSAERIQEKNPSSRYETPPRTT